MPDTDTLPLTLLPRRLAELTADPVPSYRTLYNRALDGKLPIVMIGNRYHVRNADLPAIMASHGLTPKPVPTTRTKRTAPAELAA